MPKHIPTRSCIACREAKPKRELVRVVRVQGEGDAPESWRVEIDRTGKRNGRGAYFCPAVECWELGRKRKALNHALSMTVSPDNWDELMAWAHETLPQNKVPTRVPAGTARSRRPRRAGAAVSGSAGSSA
jgi:predicted RNA-binding protein YlxR (DUF448 family)